MPRTEESLEESSNAAKYFFTIHQASTHYQLEVDPPDHLKTTSTTLLSLSEYMYMHFGLANAPATFFQVDAECILS